MADKGAHFYRCDFQVHTPRDTNWSGVRPVSDDDRRAWATEFVAACRSKGLAAVAITDHHDFTMFPFIREAAEHEVGSNGEIVAPNQRLVVFPGIELTLSVPCQALLILDADFPAQRLDAVLNRLAVDIIDPVLERLPGPTPIDFALLSELHTELDKDTWLRGSYIVFPNVTDGGHQSLLRAHMHHKYKEMPCFGGYLDGTVQDKVGDGNRRIFDGLNAQYGNKRLALIQTSDSRSEAYADLGKHSTWIKWSVPTAEALRQACLASESRISQTEPSLPNVVITKLSVSNSQFMGPIELDLNPQYNALIGGRGTGKSTCLEYLRWALCDEPVTPMADDEVPNHASRRRRLIDETLKKFDSIVYVHFVLNGIPHVVRRQATDGTVSVKVGNGEYTASSAEDVRMLLPIQAYSQRQLSTIAVKLDELNRFVTAPIRPQLDDIEKRQEAVATAIRGNYSQLQRHRSLVASLARDALAIASIEQQATNLRSTLGGLSAEDQAILAAKPRYDRADELTTQIGRSLELAEDRVSEFESSFESLLSGLPSLDAETSEAFPAVASYESEVRNLLSQLSTIGETIRTAITEGISESSPIAQAARSWMEAHSAYEQTYSDARARSTAHESKLAELERLEAQRKDLQAEIRQQTEESRALGNPEARHDELRAQWLSIQKERSDRIQEQCAKLMAQSGGLIRASLQREAGLSTLREKFRGAISGTGIRGTRQEEFFGRIEAAASPQAAWLSALDEIEQCIVSADDEVESQGRTSAASVFPASDLEKIRGRVTAETILDLALTPTEDHPKFEYRTKDGEHIAFEVASAGQQATALLGTLLNEVGPPLLIDQPEDDLDSQVILEVVEKIWSAKQVRQLIFSSHNANLVVNGDAELVVCCDYRAAGDQSGGRIKLEGAIDGKEVRGEITAVMEGGEKAFRLRKEKYGF